MTAPRETSAETAARFLALRSSRAPGGPIARASVDPASVRADAASRGFVDGWKEIAVIVGRSERSCRTLAVDAGDPLPVFKVGGMNRLLIADLDAWLERQRLAAVRARVLASEAPAIEEHW